AAGVTASFAALVGLWYVGLRTSFHPIAGVSRAVLVIDWAFSLLGLFGARVFVRLAKDLTRNDEQRETTRVLIIGAGDAGEALARELQHRPQLGMKIAGFVDDNRQKWRSHIRGIDVRGPISDVARIAEETAADEALLAIPSATGKRLREIVRDLADAGIRFRTMPGLDQLASGEAQLASLRAVNIDDLLRRDQIVISDAPVRDLFSARRIVVTGAGGSIGSELALQIARYSPSELHLFERSEHALYQCCLRIEQESPALRAIIRPHLIDCADAAGLVAEIHPAIVIHAAAHKHVPLGEQNPAEYVRNNCLVARRFAEACAAAGVERFVFISTDKAIRPANAMGASKRAAEIALLDFAATSPLRTMIVRFGNVIGSSGSVVPRFLEQIAAGGPVTVTHPDVTRYFLRSSEAISLILQAVAYGDAGKVYMLDMGEPIRIADLARDLIRLSNHSPEQIPIVYTGLRAGEKLSEDLCAEGETTHPTQHPQVMMVNVAQPPASAVADWYRRLDVAVNTQSNDLLAILREQIPEFGSERTDVETRPAYEPPMIAAPLAAAAN
ncbi:MAG TPA: nucleoside-diphosphate sugar epimerase/dehydratase, partial [Vicinamibacterales bacterium]